jgi:hypothetical protein
MFIYDSWLIHKRQNHPPVREDDCKGSVEKKSLIVVLKALGAKRNCMAVNRKETLTLTLRAG